MNIYLVMIILFTLIGIKFPFKKNNNEYLSKENTSCIKGLFILIVFYSHLYTYMPLQMEKDFMMYKLVTYLGQLMVTLFLFYSGYGVYESIKKKKEKYIKEMPKKRLLKTLIHFDIAVLTFLIVNIILGEKFDIKTILLSLIGWGTVGNSNWYIFAILGLYLITYIAFTIFDKSNKKAIICLWTLTMIFMLFIHTNRNGLVYCYNTLLCYPLGITYSYLKNKIEKKVFDNKKYIYILFVCIISYITFRNSINYNYLNYYLMTIAFTLITVLITIKIDIKSPILKWFGDNLFWVYILQRLPMLILYKIGYAENNAYRFAVICFIATILLTIIYSKTIAFIEGKLSKGHA